jgi:hypothetical protein
MEIIDYRRGEDLAPLPDNWGLLPDAGVHLPLFWIVDLDAPTVLKWGIGQVLDGHLVIYRGGGE